MEDRADQRGQVGLWGAHSRPSRTNGYPQRQARPHGLPLFFAGRLPVGDVAGVESRVTATVTEMTLMIDQTPFSSECPRCGRDRVLSGYAPEELAELLDSGAEIEGYCLGCDVRWPISTEERADLAVALSRSR